MSTTAIVLAAGEGTRMHSKRTKMLHKLLGRPLVRWAVDAAYAAGAEHLVVVVGDAADEIQTCLTPYACQYVKQTERLGTGHAVSLALECIPANSDTILVTYGDCPLVHPETLAKLVATVNSDDIAAAMLVMQPQNPAGYGRVITDACGYVESIIEDKDCTDQQRLEFTECNSGMYAFKSNHLRAHIAEIKNENSQNEYYITDMVSILRKHNKLVRALRVDDATELSGINSRVQLAQASRIMQQRINESLMERGVTMLDPSLVWVEPDVVVEADVELLPMTFLKGATRIARGSCIGPNSRLTNTVVGKHCMVEETIAEGATLDDNVLCGPRAYLRPGTRLLCRAKVGTHVEIKNSTIGKGSKVPHLSYIGDTTTGSDVNIGAGSITCNYDGVSKQKTVIGDNVFIGSDTMLVAPVTIGDGALTGASSCITQNVPRDALAIERSKQHIIEGYAKERRMRLAEKKES